MTTALRCTTTRLIFHCSTNSTNTAVSDPVLITSLCSDPTEAQLPTTDKEASHQMLFVSRASDEGWWWGCALTQPCVRERFFWQMRPLSNSVASFVRHNVFLLLVIKDELLIYPIPPTFQNNRASAARRVCLFCALSRGHSSLWKQLAFRRTLVGN